MAAGLKLSEDGLANFKENVRRSKFPGTKDHSIDVLVYALQLYTVDPKFAKETGLPSNRYTKAYDVTLTDGRHKIKCLLDPKENWQVEKNQVCTGCVIRVSPRDCSLRYKETDLSADSYAILHQFTLMGTVDPDELQGDPPYCDSSGECEKSGVPLTCGRGSYLSLWNNTDPSGREWKTHVTLSQSNIDSSQLVTIKQLAEGWKTLKRPYPALVVRVLHIGRLRYHGKYHKSAKWPYQWSVEIADRTGTCSAVLWNQLCAQLFTSLQEGVVVHLKTYTVRERFQMAMKPSICQRDLPDFNIEVSLNPHHPPSEVKILHPDNVKDEWQLPNLEYKFFTRQETSILPGEFICDVVGVITYIGRWNRQHRGGDGSDFWAQRWVCIHDQSSERPMVLDIYSTSQPDVHSNLMLGDLLVCTQMRVVTLSSTTTSQRRQFVHLTTTSHSQIYRNDLKNVVGPYSENDAVKNVVNWANSDQREHLLHLDLKAGGYFSFPPLPCDLNSYKRWFSVDKPLQLTSFEKLQFEINQLFYREQRHVVVQGFLIKVEHHLVKQRKATSTNVPHYNTRKRKMQPSDAPDIADDAVPSSSKMKKSHAGSDNANEKPAASCVIDDLRLDDTNDVTVLGMQDPHHQFFVRSVSMETRTVVHQALAFPSEQYEKPESFDQTLQDLPVASSEGFLSLDILSLNQNILIHALFPVPNKITQNTTCLGLLSGQYCQQIEQDLISTTKGLMKKLVQDGANLKGHRLLFVLDLYSFGVGQTEVIVNRAFSPL